MATQEFTNLGPIYTTQSKFDALKTAGQLEIGREYKIIDWEAQAKLTAGTNITISTDNTISADCVTLKPMKDAWTGWDPELTTAQAAELILNDADTEVGDGFLGEVYWTDLSQLGIGNAEAKAFVVEGSIVQFEMTSSNVEPYAWFYNSAAGEWRSYVPIADNLTTDSAKQALSAKQGKAIADTMATKDWVNDQKMPWLGDHGKVPSWKTEDPGAGYAFHIPYRFGFTPDLNTLNIKIYTITADGNNTYDEWDNTLPPANSIEAMSYQNAGLMTSADATAVRTTLPTKADITYVDNKTYSAAQIYIPNTITTTMTVGNMAAGTVLPANTTVLTILNKILVGDDTADAHFYYGVSSELPTTVAGLTEQGITRSDILLNGITKSFTTSDEYLILAISKSANALINLIETTTLNADLECVVGYGADSTGKGYANPYETVDEYIYALPKANGTYTYNIKFVGK